VGTEGGAAIFNGERFEAFAQGPPDGVYGITEMPEDVYWLSGGGGVWRYDSARADWRAFTSGSGDLLGYGMYGAVADPEGNVYVGSHGEGLAVIRPDLTIDFWKAPNTPFGASFSGILQASDGRLLFLASNAASVDVFDPASGQWNNPPVDLPGFPIFVDPQNRLWLNEWPSGFWVLASGGEEVHITDRHGLPADAFINSVALTRESAWLGTSLGLAKFDGQKVTELTPGTQIGLADDEINLVFAESEGALWAVGDYSLARRSPEGSWETFGQGNPFREEGVWVFDLAQGGEGTVWLATSAGVYRYDQGDWTLYTRGDPGVRLPSTTVTCITFVPDGSLWLGTDRGAARYDGATWQAFPGGPQGLISGVVRDIFVTDSGEVFFATAGGVTRLQR
jgi:ligand-binding sensor domain-containing protein